MSEPFIGEIRMFPYNFAPRGWAYCRGQLVPIQEFTALFTVIGSIYGGDGIVSMGLPNLQGRVPVQQGQGPGLSYYPISALGGQPASHIDETQLPEHTHGAVGTIADATSGVPDNTMYPAVDNDASSKFYAPSTYQRNPGSAAPMAGGALAAAGHGQNHENRQPYLTIPFCIALEGVYPSRS
ncbi:MAG: tail fiber protein [Proteobacteria bacterium]|nr:tail fiber protein [Pseudomonadota bacterium]